MAGLLACQVAGSVQVSTYGSGPEEHLGLPDGQVSCTVRYFPAVLGHDSICCRVRPSAIQRSPSVCPLVGDNYHS